MGFTAPRALPLRSTCLPRNKFLSRCVQERKFFVLPSSTSVPYAQHADIQRKIAGSHFSQIVKYGGVVYLAGQVARGTDGSVAAQTREILRKIDILLREAGTDRSRLLSANVWMTDISKAKEMNEEWDKWVGSDNKPVRACVQSSPSDREITVEIMATAALPSGKRMIKTANAASAVGPYSQGVVAENGTIYVSGCIGLSTGNEPVLGGTIEEQTKQTLANLRAITEAGGAAISDIVKTTLILQNMSDFTTVNKIYEEFFSETLSPARTTFAAKELPRNALIMIDATIQLPS